MAIGMVSESVFIVGVSKARILVKMTLVGLVVLRTTAVLGRASVGTVRTTSAASARSEIRNVIILQHPDAKSYAWLRQLESELRV